jgi:hypothetical protein
MYDRYTSGAHGQNMRCSCACHPTHAHGVPRIFLTAPLAYAAETYAMPKVSSFRATENSQPVLYHRAARRSEAKAEPEGEWCVYSESVIS